MPDEMQYKNLEALLNWLKTNNKGAIQPTNYPGVPKVDALTQSYLKNVPGALPGDIENTGYDVTSLRDMAAQGQYGGDAMTQLMQLLTAHIRGQR